MTAAGGTKVVTILEPLEEMMEVATMATTLAPQILTADGHATTRARQQLEALFT